MFSIYVLLAGVEQGISAIPLSVQFSDSSEADFIDAARGAVGTALTFGLATGFVALATVGLVPEAMRWPIVALALGLPGLMTQDSLRFAFIASKRPDRALVNDAVWAVGQGVGVLAVVADHGLSAGGLVAAWGFGGTLAAGVGLLQAGIMPQLSRTPHWLVQHVRLVLPFATEAIAIRATGNLALALAAVFVGLSGAGALRGAQILMSPIGLAFQGALFVLVPEGVRALKDPAEDLASITRGATAVAVGLCAAWCAALLFIPPSLGRELLGETWIGARVVLPAFCIANLATSACLAPRVMLRAFSKATVGLRAQLATTAITIVAAFVGGAAYGTVGAAAGLALGAVLPVPMWWFGFRTALREHTHRRPRAEHSAAPPVPTR